MGYTHYWNRHEPIAASRGEAFGRLAMDAKALIEAAEALGIAVAGPLGDGRPEITEGHIALNGSAACGGDYESFVWAAQDAGFGFTKTAHRPYDALVTAILIRAKSHYGSAVEVTSDGRWADWAEGRALVLATFGEEPTVPVLGAGR